MRNISGDNIWAGNIELAGADNLIGVNAGTRLEITGSVSAILSAGRDLIKVGAGTLRLSGSTDNVYTGQTVVGQGTLELNKTPGQDAIGGDLVIGDNFGGDDAAKVVLMASHQIPKLNQFDAALTTVTLASSGRLEFLNSTISEEVGNLTLTIGQTYSSDIDLNGGTLTLGGANLVLAASGQLGTSGASAAATIANGTFDLGTFFSGANGGATKAINVADTQLANVATDLHISAKISGTADVSVTKAGTGTLRLSGDNGATLASPFIMNGGFIEVGHNNAFGTGLLNLQNNGNVLRAVGGAKTIANAVDLAGNLSTIGSDNIEFSGPVTLASTTATTRTILVMDEAQTVTISRVIDEGIYGTQAFAKSGRGTMVMTNANTYSGATTVNNDADTLILRGNGSVVNSHTVTVGIGSTLVLDNSGTNLPDRLNDLVLLNNNGTFHFIGNTSAHSTEQVGTFTPGSGISSIIPMENTSGGAFDTALRTLRFDSASDRPARIVGVGQAINGTTNRVEAQTAPGGLLNAVISHLLVINEATGRSDFATLESNGYGAALLGLPASAYITDISQAGNGSNVRLSGGTHTLTSGKFINSLILADGAVINGDAVLTINSGGMVFEDDGSSLGTDLDLIFGNAHTNIFTLAGTAVIDSQIINTNNTQFNKNGLGKLVLTGDNQFGAAGASTWTLVNEGILNIQHSNALGATVAGVAVRPNASLELEDNGSGAVNVTVEALTLDGMGGLDNRGALRNVAGNNSWAGTISMAGNATNLLFGLDGFPILNSTVTNYHVAAGSSLRIDGAINNNIEVLKTGGGTLEFRGILPNGFSAATRILEGTLLLNKENGGTSIGNQIFVGTDRAGAPAATLRLGASDQIRDDRLLRVLSSGTFDLNGQSEAIGALDLVVGPNGASSVTLGATGILRNQGGITVLTKGTGNAAGATITGGTLALNILGGVSAARTFNVNDGATGTDLTITSAIVDGSGFANMGVTKNGFGTLEFGGSTANTYTGTTSVNEGTLLLNKGTGTGGVNALSGALTIGDGNVTNGFAKSDVVRWLQPNQLPDFNALVTVNSPGWMDLNGNDETIGGPGDAQDALSLLGAAAVTTGAGTLTLNGNILATNSAPGVALWTPVVGSSISGNLNLGSVVRTVNVGDRSELPIELQIDANISGTGGLNKIGTGGVALSGANTYTGSTYLNGGTVFAGSDTAFGGSRVYLQSATNLYAQGGARTFLNTFDLTGVALNLVGGGNVGDGGNQITFGGAVNLVGGTTTFNVAIAGTVEFLGGLGESFGAQSLAKTGFGTLVISSAATYSGATTINLNGGSIVLAD